MKRLYFLRHAKSERPPGATDDFERGLNARGRRAAPDMGRYLRWQRLIPDFVLCSAARRARETWELVRGQLRTDVRAEFSERLYLATSAQILRLARELPEAADSALLVGHNPGLQSAALQLVGGGEDAARARLQSKFPTAALAVVDFDIRYWRDLAPGSGRLERFVAPRDLDGRGS